MDLSDIVIKGAREHNLRDVDVVLPRNRLICLTGVSGSGKSSLAFDTLFAEGQRRYVESLSSFARHFLQQMPKPDVDLISGLSPSISISQKTSGSNPRSTVGTITEIYDFLRILYARAGTGYCPRCDVPIAAQSRDQMVAALMQLPPEQPLVILAPVVRGQKGEHVDLLIDLNRQGFLRARIDGEIRSLSEPVRLDRKLRHDIEVVVDRVEPKASNRSRIAEAVDSAMKTGNRTMIVLEGDAAPDALAETGGEEGSGGSARQPHELLFSGDYACGKCGAGYQPPSPQLFSFNSPHGMCLNCMGLGQLYTFVPELLVPNARLSVKQGCIAILGDWKATGRWRRHIFQGVADTLERVRGLPEGTLLETPWQDLPEELRQVWLNGAGDQHITFTWRGGAAPMKYGGLFNGVVSELTERYRNLKSASKQRQFEELMDQLDCPVCRGLRLNPQACSVRIRSATERYASPAGHSLPEVCDLPIDQAVEFFSALEFDPVRQIIATQPLKEIRQRLSFLINVGLEYLSLGRTAPTLSGGESQRIRLAGQIGAGLVGVVYILDEPSIGLHARDNDRLIGTLENLRDLGNTVVVVEHDEDTMRAADHLIDFGPGPGVHGGHVVASGSVADLGAKKDSVTGQFLNGKRSIAVPGKRRPLDLQRSLRVIGACHNNLKGIDVAIPLGGLVCITGVSGSGKSSLVNDILIEALNSQLNGGLGEPGRHERIEGAELLDKMIAIDQSPIGRTPRSNPGTYVKLFDEIRKLFTQLPEAKKRGFAAGRFSFNVKGGRCEACEGNGSTRLEMDFLADIWVTCPVCEGRRFNRETLQVRFRDKTIADVLGMSIEAALEFFVNVPKIASVLQTLQDVGLDYLTIGQPSPTLSGGEAQRIKLARELVRKSTGKTLYLLDEPTTGLHFADIDLLLKVLHRFADGGNTVVVIEHNLDVIKTADWIIDIGPEGGRAGGEIVCCGTPEEVAACDSSWTGKALRRVLGERSQRASAGKRKAPSARVAEATHIEVHNARQHNLRGVDVRIERNAMTVFCGPSGSGKSSLAMDTIYAEGQRRYVESLSSYARQFVGQMEKPLVDQVTGLSPAIAIEQKNFGSTPRSTVGTVTEVYDYLRILFARLGTPWCPDCNVATGTQTSDQIVDKILDRCDGQKLVLCAPVQPDAGQDWKELWEELRGKGYQRVRIDARIVALETAPELSRTGRHEVEVVLDRVDVRAANSSRLADSIEGGLGLGKGLLMAIAVDEAVDQQYWPVARYSQHLACDQCGRGFELLTPNNFSFNSQLGWCRDCEGLGTQQGANPALLIQNMESSLAEGALRLWPGIADPLARQMLEAVCTAGAVDMDRPFSQLDARQRRILFFGTGQRWFRATDPETGCEFEFQFTGLYPALDAASRLSTSLRLRMQALMDEVECGSCGGSRLRDDASAMRFRDMTVDGLCRLPLGQLLELVKSWKLDRREKKIAGELFNEVINRVQFLFDVGLEYLTLGRASNSLSGGEAQRIRLASQLGSGLVGVLYVLDEPTIGLHPRDNLRLLGALRRLRDLGNTLIVVEHDREVIRSADAIVDFGPRAGIDGGQIVAEGPPAMVAKAKTSVTGPWLAGSAAIPVPTNRRPGLEPFPSNVVVQTFADEAGRTKRGKKKPPVEDTVATARGSFAESLRVTGARHHNLKGIDVGFPLGTLTVVTGPSGCGKSSLVNDILYAALARRLHMAGLNAGAHKRIDGLEHINKVIRVDQSPLGNSPSSNPATYTGAFELIRQLFAELPEARVRGFTPRQFSFNVAGGRCEACSGNGQKCIEMHFLPDVWVPCEVCNGKRYTEETLAIKFHGQSINDVLNMPCGAALQLFANLPAIRRILQTLCDVGLDYVRLGQSAPTLSGGEAQRVKLAAELARPDTGRTVYMLDEPTTGLHFQDLARLLEVLQRLVDLGNTVILIEHNLDIIKAADWVIDLGPEAGHQGGELVVAGTPEMVVAYADSAKASRGKLPRSWTGEALQPVLAAGPHAERPPWDPAREREQTGLELKEDGAGTLMPWEADGRDWHTVHAKSHSGEPVQWAGKILAEVVARIEADGRFAPANWNARSVVEIMGGQPASEWFLHALTGDQWMLKLKFRVPPRAFRQDQLLVQVPLKPNNQLDGLPVYGNEPRLRVHQRTGFQEIEFRLHAWEEADVPGFWKFLQDAIGSRHGQKRPDAGNGRLPGASPQQVLGLAWHASPKLGFPNGETPGWDTSLVAAAVRAVMSEDPNLKPDYGHPAEICFELQDPPGVRIVLETKHVDSLLIRVEGPADFIRETVDIFPGELISGQPGEDEFHVSDIEAYGLDEAIAALFGAMGPTGPTGPGGTSQQR